MRARRPRARVRARGRTEAPGRRAGRHKREIVVPPLAQIFPRWHLFDVDGRARAEKPPLPSTHDRRARWLLSRRLPPVTSPRVRSPLRFPRAIARSARRRRRAPPRALRPALTDPSRFLSHAQARRYSRRNARSATSPRPAAATSRCASADGIPSRVSARRTSRRRRPRSISTRPRRGEKPSSDRPIAPLPKGRRPVGEPPQHARPPPRSSPARELRRRSARRGRPSTVERTLTLETYPPTLTLTLTRDAGPEPRRPVRARLRHDGGVRVLRGEQEQGREVGRRDALRLPVEPEEVHSRARRWFSLG